MIPTGDRTHNPGSDPKTRNGDFATIAIQLPKVALTIFLGGNMTTKLNYVIEFVGDMERAVKFYKEVVGLELKFQSPDWSEFSTGETTLALHPASDKNVVGKVEIGFGVPHLDTFYENLLTKGVKFPMPPQKQDFGGTLAQFEDSEGAHVSVTGNS